MKRPVRIAAAVGVLVLGCVAFVLHARATFPAEKTPEGAYARIAVAITEGRPRDCFAYLETEAQWASYSIRDFRAKATALVESSYPEPERSTLLAAYKAEAQAPDGADVFRQLAESRGWLARLRKDLSGIRSVDTQGDRATVETARGTRYTLRRRDNGIWGLTTFTAELLAASEKAARDYDIVKRAAEDYRKGSPSPAEPPSARPSAGDR
jgi:hypothetical protein